MCRCDCCARCAGIELVELPNIDRCCGFGGTFAIKMGDVSAAMLAEKMRDVENTGAEVVTAVDNSCLMHIFGGLHRQRAGVRMAHIAEILAPTEQRRGSGRMTIRVGESAKCALVPESRVAAA